jgi:glycosyltransferase involved in cell wall biosynthesis
LSSQRQAGINASTQPYIAIIDGDDHLEPDFLSRLLHELQTCGYDALLGREVAFEPKTYWERAMGSTNHGITYTEKPVDTNMVGRPSLYRTAAIRHCGFDPFFDGVGDEDTDLSIRMELAGFRQGIGTGMTRRQQTPSFSGIVKKFVKYGRGDARIVYKYPFKAGKLMFHLAVRYPFIRGAKAIARGEGVYWPFYLMYGWVRVGALLPELARLLLRRPPHGPYPGTYVHSDDNSVQQRVA